MPATRRLSAWSANNLRLFRLVNPQPRSPAPRRLRRILSLEMFKLFFIPRGAQYRAHVFALTYRGARRGERSAFFQHPGTPHLLGNTSFSLRFAEFGFVSIFLLRAARVLQPSARAFAWLVWGGHSCPQLAILPTGPARNRVRRLKSLPHSQHRGSRKLRKWPSLTRTAENYAHTFAIPAEPFAARERSSETAFQHPKAAHPLRNTCLALRFAQFGFVSNFLFRGAGQNRDHAFVIPYQPARREERSRGTVFQRPVRTGTRRRFEVTYLLRKARPTLPFAKLGFVSIFLLRAARVRQLKLRSALFTPTCAAENCAHKLAISYGASTARERSCGTVFQRAAHLLRNARLTLRAAEFGFVSNFSLPLRRRPAPATT